MIVYGSSISPYVRKVLAFGAEKGLALELEPAGMGRGGPAFAEASPFGKMPGFRDPGGGAAGADFCISDSSAIVTYLEAKFPEPNLIPTDPAARARTIWFDEFADTIIMAAGSKIFFNRFVAPRVLGQPGDQAAADQAEATELPPLIDYIERVLPASGFLIEDRITLADLAVASPFVNFAHVDVAIDPARWPKAVAYVARILQRPSFAPIVAQERTMIAAMAAR